MIEFYQSTRILAAPEHPRRNDAQQDADAHTARFDLHHHGEKHHGKEQYLQSADIYNEIHKAPPFQCSSTEQNSL